MTHLSISQARSRLTQLAGRLAKDREAVEVTSRGRPVLAILPWEFYEGLEETIEILEDEALMKQLGKAIKEIRHGKVMSLEKVRRELGL